MLFSKARLFLAAVIFFASLMTVSGTALAAGEAGYVTTLAGMGGSGMADGANASAEFFFPQDLFLSGKSLYVLDTNNHLIRHVSGGSVSTLVGNASEQTNGPTPAGYYIDGDYSTALFSRPTGGVAVKDTIYIADSNNHAIRAITAYGVYTYSGRNVGYEDGVRTQARFNCPTALAVDGNGNLYVADTLNDCIRVIDKNGMVSTVKGTREEFDCPSGIAVTGDGSVIYVSDTGNNRVCKIESGIITEIAAFNLPVGLAYDDGVLYVAESGAHMIKAVTADGEVITLAGDGEPGDVDGVPMEARFNMPKGVCVSDGVLYIADTGNNKIKQMPLDDNLLK